MARAASVAIEFIGLVSLQVGTCGRFDKRRKALSRLDHRPILTCDGAAGINPNSRVGDNIAPMRNSRTNSPLDQHLLAPTSLDALAIRCGIQPEYKSALGEITEASAETRRALLHAMGIAADTDAAAARSLAELDRAEGERALPPVCVLHQTKPPHRISTTRPPADVVNWTIALEDGTTRTGQADWDSLAELEPASDRVGPSGDGETPERRALPLPTDLPCGYHELTTDHGRAHLIVTPGKCWLPEAIEQGDRLWGVSAQLYLLRSKEDWGIGDYSDLARLAQILIPRGASLIGLNPLHAMFLDEPEHASPYSPASRLLLNVLNIDVGQVAQMMGSALVDGAKLDPGFQAELERLRALDQLAYTDVARVKLPLLEKLYDEWREPRHASKRLVFDAFRRDQGPWLERHILFLALRDHFTRQQPSTPCWRDWPPEFHDPASPSVARFAADHASLVTFHAWLQYLADWQLEAAADAASPMRIGLYRDLAVGADRCGAETWANQSAVVASAQVGAPPDIYNRSGQDWGLPPFNPRTLREEGYRSFIELIRANMRHAGGLRIDHVMGLQQLYWVPTGSSPKDGAYVRYPLEDLVGILSLESTRHRCLVVGEDLGTVPDGFRDAMSDANILSYRVLYFEKSNDGFAPPASYPKLALAVSSSHDLPTLRAWWEASDLALKEQLDLFPESSLATKAKEERARDRLELSTALRGEKLVQGNVEPNELFAAAHEFLARTRAALTVVQLDDICDEVLPVNVPCTSEEEHPNWRRRSSMTLEELSTAPRLEAIQTIMQNAHRSGR